ncbi:MAG TPA: hypothetical protein PKD85_15890 [Saprospiraceae bacterium]|nr:hypothetical protein [Saprospiraceae bacterium]
MQTIKLFFSKYDEKDALEKAFFWLYCIYALSIVVFLYYPLNKYGKLLFAGPMIILIFAKIALWVKIAPSKNMKPSRHFMHYSFEDRKLIASYYFSSFWSLYLPFAIANLFRDSSQILSFIIVSCLLTVFILISLKTNLSEFIEKQKEYIAMKDSQAKNVTISNAKALKFMLIGFLLLMAMITILLYNNIYS